MKWLQLIGLKYWIIGEIKKAARKQARNLTDNEHEEINFYEDQIKRYNIYCNIGLPCNVK
jgi:hypothetical protein